MALTLLQVEEISRLLLLLPPLIDRLEQKRSDFPEGILAWLKQTEHLLENTRQPSVSKIASLRALVLAAGRGVQMEGIALLDKPTSRKLKDAAASLAAQRASDLLLALVEERQVLFRDAERLARQLVVLAEAKNLIASCRACTNHQEYLLCVQHNLANDPDLANLVLHMKTLVGQQDFLVFIDRAIEL